MKEDSSLARNRQRLRSTPGRPDIEGLKSSEARKRMVDRACALVLGQPDQPMSTLALCRDLGASPRKLAYCFREVLGTSPARYLRAVRLSCGFSGGRA
jgi:AraC family transcriptional regulator, ethanolamine operon transcriptional activator